MFVRDLYVFYISAELDTSVISLNPILVSISKQCEQDSVASFPE